MLDVGCGRGGSAEYLRRHGWGHVEGIDRDTDSIEYARATYPEIGFHICDVLDVPRTVTREFDLIYSFKRSTRSTVSARRSPRCGKSRSPARDSSSSITPSATNRSERNAEPHDAACDSIV